MESEQVKSNINGETAKDIGGVSGKKVRFPLYIHADTMETVDMLFEKDDCRSKTEFIEKAVRFYCGSVLNKQAAAVEYIAPQLSVIAEGMIKGTEQRLSRAMFKLAVEVGALTHMLAALNDIDDETLKKLRVMCIDEVKRINGIINFEKAVRYQRSDE